MVFYIFSVTFIPQFSESRRKINFSDKFICPNVCYYAGINSVRPLNTPNFNLTSSGFIIPACMVYRQTANSIAKTNTRSVSGFKYFTRAYFDGSFMIIRKPDMHMRIYIGPALRVSASSSNYIRVYTCFKTWPIHRQDLIVSKYI
jgi:hypothetical protein